MDGGATTAERCPTFHGVESGGMLCWADALPSGRFQVSERYICNALDESLRFPS